MIRARVARARERQVTRQGVLNASLSATDAAPVCRLDTVSERLLSQAMSRYHFSESDVRRVLRVSRTIADLADHDEIASIHVAEAIQQGMRTTASPV
jgi:magnesium chelatase family protein